MRGPVVTPGDPDFAADAQLFNIRFDGTVPRAVAYALDERDVVAAVRWAARYDVPIAARSGGHSYAGYSTVANGLLLDISDLSRIEVRPDGRRAVAGAGAELSEVYTALAGRGLTIPAGTCPTVGLAGLALGGGVGFVSRRWGTTSDNVMGLRVVTADGRARTVDRRHDPDLHWACRGGGGGNFGVVTAFRLRTFPTSPAVSFRLAYAWTDLAAVVGAWQGWAPSAPDDLFSICSIQAKGGTPTLQVSGQLFGTADDVPAAVAPLTAAATPTSITTSPKNWAAAISWWAECTPQAAAQCRRHQENPDGRVARRAFWGKSQYVTAPLPADGIRVIQQFMDQAKTVPGLSPGEILLDSYGGAINRRAPGATAFVHRDNLFSMQLGAYWDDDADRAGAVAWLRGFADALRPFSSGMAYQNYIDPDLTDWRRAYYGSNYPRLAHVKGRYDPDGVFRFAQGITR
jgi:FAD/FMN-containing dehydrogenase